MKCSHKSFRVGDFHVEMLFILTVLYLNGFLKHPLSIYYIERSSFPLFLEGVDTKDVCCFVELCTDVVEVKGFVGHIDLGVVFLSLIDGFTLAYGVND